MTNKQTETMLVCDGCGSTMTDSELAEEKKIHQNLIACCPDRKMVEQPIANINIETMVDRFLSWRLPLSVSADVCATKYGTENRFGTNLLNADEARQMIEHVVKNKVALASMLLDQQLAIVADGLQIPVEQLKQAIEVVKRPITHSEHNLNMVQEPIGYIGLRTLERINSNHSGIDTHGISKEKFIENDIPVYINPPSREQLSDDDVRKVIYAIEDKFGMALIGGWAIARAIEKAHGIGVK